MPFCPDCGTKVSEETQFCPECGKRLIKPQSEQSTTSEAQEETEAAEPEALGAEMKRDIRGWGFGLIVIGVIHIVFLESLDPIWGGILIAIGVSCLLIIRRGMYIVIGIGIMLAGIMNILFTQFGGWTIFGVFQIGFGIYQIHKFRKYGGIQPIRTQDYDKAIELNPDNADAYYKRGDAYDEMGEYGKAIADYNKAIELDPNHTLAYYNRGCAYGEIGAYDKAIADYNKAIELNPNDALAYYNRGLAYREKGEVPKVVSDLEKCISLSTDPELTKDAQQALYEIKNSP